MFFIVTYLHMYRGNHVKIIAIYTQICKLGALLSYSRLKGKLVYKCVFKATQLTGHPVARAESGQISTQIHFQTQILTVTKCETD